MFGRAAAEFTTLPSCDLWGVLNVTPDSFSDGGRWIDPVSAVARGHAMVDEGADVIDVGGESSRPAGSVYGVGFSSVPEEEEAARVCPVIKQLAREIQIPISIDTVKAYVARKAVEAGASIVNDVSGGCSRELLRVVAGAGVELVLMHNRGDGSNTGLHIEYNDVVKDVRAELMQAVERAIDAGVVEDRIWLDPGIGFAKTALQSVTLLASIDALVDTGFRVLVGPSRKSFIAALSSRGGVAPGADARLGGSAAAVALAVLRGAHAVRVHDVADMYQAVRVAEAGIR